MIVRHRRRTILHTDESPKASKVHNLSRMYEVSSRSPTRLFFVPDNHRKPRVDNRCSSKQWVHFTTLPQQPAAPSTTVPLPPSPRTLPRIEKSSKKWRWFCAAHREKCGAWCVKKKHFVYVNVYHPHRSLTRSCRSPNRELHRSGCF